MKYAYNVQHKTLKRRCLDIVMPAEAWLRTPF